MKIAITVDVHIDDSPDDIIFASEWLAENNIPTTFFVPSNLFYLPKFSSILSSIPSLGHEVASHSHLHDNAEYDALTQNDECNLNSLVKSKKTFEDFYGKKPLAFRAPCWCYLSKAALNILEELEYSIDSSSTPQRLSILSSYPYKNAWTLSPRAPYLIRPNLLEIPTSRIFLPAGSMTFAVLRSFSHLFIAFLGFESKLCRNRIINLQFHPCDFNPKSKIPNWKTPLKLTDFIPSSRGGLKFRHLLPESDPQKLCNLTYSIMESFNSASFLTMTKIRQDYKYSSLVQANSVFNIEAE